ncbi:MAG: GNAT family N-acetyltransferase [Candidatus Thorarchaeota archaeon]
MDKIKSNVFIEGEHINILPINFDHLELYSRWENDPKIRKFLRNDLPVTKENYKKRLESLQKDRPNEIVFEICHGEENVPIGICELSEIDWTNRVSFVGILIGEKIYWGQNFCTEAIRLLTKYAFEELNLHKLKYGSFSPNKASLRCAEKAGFSHEATLKQEIYIDGKYYDTEFYTLFRDKWLKENR